MNNKKGILKVIGIGIIVILSIGLLIAISFGSEHLNLKWKEYFGTKHRNVDREIWEESNSRVYGSIQDISKKQLEYNRAKDNLEKQMICDYLATSYVDIDSSKINSYNTRQFFENCRMG